MRYLCVCVCVWEGAGEMDIEHEFINEYLRAKHLIRLNFC